MTRGPDEGDERRERGALPRATKAELALDGDFGMISFTRPDWHYALAFAFLWPALLGGRTLMYRIRVRWNAEHVVIESWPQRRGRKLARTELAAIHRAGEALEARLTSGDALPLVAGRRVREADLDRGRDLAYRLHVPFVDDTGGALALPPARVR